MPKKTTIFGTIALATVAGITYLGGAGDPIPTPLTFNGHTTEMSFTDDNTGEDLIIYTDSERIGSWSEATGIMSATNISGKDQTYQFQFHTGKNEDLVSLEEYIPQVPYEIEVDDFALLDTCKYSDFEKKEVCYKEKVGSHMETRYKDEWGVVIEKTVENFDSKDVKKQEGFTAKSQSEFLIADGETKYFKYTIKHAPGGLKKNNEGKFFIKAFGSKGSYGSLDPWYGTAGWLYRKSITIDHTKVTGSGNFTAFPVDVDLTDSGLQANAQADGDDILFTSSDGTTKLDHEIEIYTSATGRLTAWVEIPTLDFDDNTIIYMYYGNAGASSQQNATGVWDSNYTGVWHMPDGTTLTSNDSTSGGHNATQFNTPTASAGKIDGAATFASASSQYMTVADYADLDAQTFTVSGWFKTSTTGVYQEIMRRDVSAGVRSFLLRVDNDNKVTGLLIYGGNPGVTSASTYTDGNWHYVVMTATFSNPNTALELFIDGVSQGTNTATAGAPASTEGLDIARYNDVVTPEYMNGSLDELRHSKIARSTDWITTEYNNQSATSTFYTIGSVENEPVASTLISTSTVQINGQVNLNGQLSI